MDLKETTGELKKGLITFSPLAQGQLTDRYLHGIPEDSRIRTDGDSLKKALWMNTDWIRSVNSMIWLHSVARSLQIWLLAGSSGTKKSPVS